MTRFFFLILMVGSTSLCLGQETGPAPETGRVSVATDPSGADLFLDSLYLGKTPLMNIIVPVGKHAVRVVYPSAFSWKALAKVETVLVAAESHQSRIIEMGTHAVLTSDPEGGRVTYQGTELGKTPLFLRRSSKVTGELTIEKEGYVPQKVSLDAARSSTSLRLQPLPETLANAAPEILPADYDLSGTDNWLTYTSFSSMVVSGVLSAHFKHQANRDFDSYLVTKDPALLNSTRRLDNWAAVTFVLTQVSFAVLTYVLLSD
ncbi:MAG: PEGA domain-containing protein [Bacteroidota bacterium]